MVRAPTAEASTPVVISDINQLCALSATPAFFFSRPIILGLPGMSPAEAFAAAERLNRHRTACGCSLGAQAMTAAFLLALAWLVMRYGLFSLALLAHLPIAIGIAVLCAALGKAIGIAVGHRRARVEVARIQSRYFAHTDHP